MSTPSEPQDQSFNRASTPPAWPQQQPVYVAPPGYPPQYYPPPRATNGLAIASMVLGILWIYWIGSLLALIFGYVARTQIRERNESGDGMAIAGIVLGWIGAGTLAIVIILAMVTASSNGFRG